MAHPLYLSCPDSYLPTDSDSYSPLAQNNIQSEQSQTTTNYPPRSSSRYSTSTNTTRFSIPFLSTSPHIAAIGRSSLNVLTTKAAKSTAITYPMAPVQPAALPPAYIMDFVRRVFTDDLCLVDFTQALNAMDHLRDMEAMRKKEMGLVLERLDIDANTLDKEKERLRIEQPVVAEWMANVVDKAKRVESLYTQVYIGLRRWTLINEMRLEPFNKTNCIGMLNAVYPSNNTVSPSSSLTPMHLNSQRNAFFRYIMSVETNGKNVLAKLEQQGKRPQDANAWPIVRDIVDKYLRTSNQLIQTCRRIKNAADVEANPVDKRTDSGISLSSSKSTNSQVSFKSSVTFDEPPSSTTQTSHLDIPRSRSASATSFHRKSTSNGDIPIVRPDQLRQKDVRKVGSTLERLARELKRMRSRSNDRAIEEGRYRPDSRSCGSSGASSEIDESAHQFSITNAPLTATTANFPESYRDDDHIAPLPTPTARTKSLKKIKSVSALNTRDSSYSTFSKHSAPRTPHTPRMPSSVSGASGSTLSMHAMGPSAIERKYSVQPFSITEEERTRMIVRARAEKESAAQVQVSRYSPIRSRSNSSESDKEFLEPAIVPVRKTSPGRNKLRDYFGVDTLQVPTNFAN